LYLQRELGAQSLPRSGGCSKDNIEIIIVEDEEGKRYWIFRLEFYDDKESVWFVHAFLRDGDAGYTRLVMCKRLKVIPR
jgi:hypothetical protein